MNDLKTRHCEGCEEGAPPITQRELDEFMPLLPRWRVVERDGIQRLERELRFNDFAEALAFVNRVGALAEEEGHHPALLLEHGRVTLSWWTHKVGGLHLDDLIMASRSDDLV